MIFCKILITAFSAKIMIWPFSKKVDPVHGTALKSFRKDQVAKSDLIYTSGSENSWSHSYHDYVLFYSRVYFIGRMLVLQISAKTKISDEILYLQKLNLLKLLFCKKSAFQINSQLFIAFLRVCPLAYVVAKIFICDPLALSVVGSSCVNTHCGTELTDF